MTKLNSSDVFSGFGVKVNATLIGGVTQCGVTNNTEVKGENVSGDPFPRFKSVAGQKPMAAWTTHAIAKALAACGISGFNCAAGAGLSLYLWKMVGGGSRSVTTDNKILAIAHGLMVPVTLSCNTGADALLSYNAHLTWDGTNNPVICTSGAVPAGLADDEKYSLGAVTIGNVTIDRVQSISLNFGIKVEAEGGSSEIWPDIASIAEVSPKLTIKTRSMTALANLLPYAAATQANTTVALRKRVRGGAWNGTGDITIAACGTVHLPEPWQVAGVGKAEQTIEVDIDYDGTNDIVKFS